MTDDRERWALILGASSGMGEATARALVDGLAAADHPEIPELAARRDQLLAEVVATTHGRG